MDFTCNLLSNYIDDEFNLDKFDYITLKTKSGKWIKPKKILYSGSYQPDHRLEKLYDNQLLDGNYEFLSDDYLNNYIKDNIQFENYEQISGFFTELGVDTLLLNHDKTTERIGILCALKYEKKENRDAIEIGQSRSKTGDIQSTDDNNSEIIIEVKARKEKNPDIDLTINQSKKITQNKIHFLYIISNALKKPELTILSSTKILELASSKIHLKNSKWNKKSHIHGKMTFKI